MEWYSAQLLYVRLEHGVPQDEYVYRSSVVVFVAESPVEARHRALELGRGKEFIAREEGDHLVRTALVALQAVDRIGRDINGREVSAYEHRSADPVSFDEEFHPEFDTPHQTLQ